MTVERKAEVIQNRPEMVKRQRQKKAGTWDRNRQHSTRALAHLFRPSLLQL